jgi:ParB family chromosome partitioning protein
VIVALNLSMLDDVSLDFRDAGMPARAPLAAFEEDPDNPRFEKSPEEFDRFLADVRARGILQPVVVRRLENGRLRICFGARRYRAAVELGLSDIPYVITEDQRQLDGYAQVSENQQRSQLQPLELATFIEKKVKEGESRRAVASSLGIDPSAVTHLLALVGEPPAFLMELYHSRLCRSPWILYRLRLMWGTEPSLIEDACARASEFNGALLEALEDRVAPDRGALTGDDGDVVAGGKPTTAVMNYALGTAVPGEAPAGIADVPSAKAPRRKTTVRRRSPNPELLWPQMFGICEGREVLLLPDLASREGQMFVRFVSSGMSEQEEVAVDSIRLTRLLRSAS